MSAPVNKPLRGYALVWMAASILQDPLSAISMALPHATHAL